MFSWTEVSFWKIRMLRINTNWTACAKSEAVFRLLFNFLTTNKILLC